MITTRGSEPLPNEPLSAAAERGDASLVRRDDGGEEVERLLGDPTIEETGDAVARLVEGVDDGASGEVGHRDGCARNHVR